MLREAAFIAVQCVQCSTMQVKQQRRRGNKWTCAVCNQRQSVLRVFARGPLAKDVRLFVQRFNMSRASDGPSPPAEESVWEEEVRAGARTDWSEYLEPDVEEEEDEKDETLRGDFVTEMPKRQSRKYPRKSAPLGVDSRSFKPNFSKKQGGNSSNHYQKYFPLVVEANKASHSKWDKYMEEETEKVTVDVGGGSDGALWEDGEAGVRVEEEVHPDFM